ncbi:MAG: DUF3883 domain-containing protein [Bifidobacteriaceae bacterium]|jgi:hypothetical protein|nr:DUF3883 domain-containing protein [Bifidobacteriaceae bacterium]
MADDTVVSLTTLKPGLRVCGLIPGRVATLVSVEPLDEGVAQVAFRDEAGKLAEQYVSEERAAGLTVVSEADAAPRFDGAVNDFRLAAEALRIKYAALYDPMVAVNSSDVEPLPHQIRAVYEDFLPRVPLRQLLADDPGAGRTIMVGLYIKELMLRSDCERALIVAPGGLVEQWREELASKFDLRFEVFSRYMVDDAAGRNVFAEHPYLIARMDQLSRDEDWREQLRDTSWDVVVVDEAHRMSAHYWGQDVKETKRFQLGKLFSETAQNFLLMTATPHAGKEDDFQLFRSLLDADRFEGQYREGVHRTDTAGLMIRRTKEELLTFEGKPLFPERRAYTVAYELSDAEQELYEQVTEYVRTEMGRADRIAAAGDVRRGNNIGFALTTLQRRLASSPEAILRSLERRQARLKDRLKETQRAADHAAVTFAPPYLDYDAPEAAEAAAIQRVIAEPWIAANNEATIKRWAYHHGTQPRKAELTTRIEAETARVRQQVTQRLTSEMNHWDREYNRLAELERLGKPGKIRSETAQAKARERELRLDRRLAELDQATQLVELPAHVRGCALVIPSSILAAGSEANDAEESMPPGETSPTRETEESERRAVEKVMAAERALGRTPEEMDHYNPGYDIRSTDDQGRTFYIEVKGYLKGAREFEITNREVATAQNQGDRHRLALVAVDPDEPARDELRYVTGSLDHLRADLTTTRFMEKWSVRWSRGGEPR